MSEKVTKNKKYEFVAPDGGWGYVICLGVILNLMCTTGFINCFGMIYNELFIELKMDSATVTFFYGVSVFSASLSALMTNFLLKYMSPRKLGLTAAFIFNLGIFGTVFANSTPHFFISQGLLQGIGLGITYNLSCTMVNDYFVKRRLLATSVTQTLIAAWALVTPQFVKWSIETYGLRGVLIMTSAVSMHCFLGMTLMQPVSWHMKRIEVPADKDNETKSILVEDNFATNTEDLTGCINYKLEDATKVPNGHYETEEENLKNHSSRLKKVLSQFIDTSLFKTFLLSNACFGSSLCFFTESTYISMLPQALYFMGWNEREVAWALSLNALGDLVTRSLFIFMSSLLAKVGSHKIYVVGLVIAIGSRLGMLWSDNRTIMVAFMTIMGIARCTIMLLMPLVVAEAVDQEKFTSALGLQYLFSGLFTLVIGPVIGTVRDLTDSYSTAFYILTSFFAIVTVLWSIELLYKNNKHKRQPKVDIDAIP